MRKTQPNSPLLLTSAFGRPDGLPRTLAADRDVERTSPRYRKKLGIAPTPIATPFQVSAFSPLAA